MWFQAGRCRHGGERPEIQRALQAAVEIALPCRRDPHHILKRNDLRLCRRPAKGDVMERFRKTAIATRVVLLLGIAVATPAAAATFDGSWDVQIASPNAACANAATVSIGITDGQAASTNPPIMASGRVAATGNTHVTLASGIN